MYTGREIFTNREKELSFLWQLAEDLRKRRPRHLAILGLRRAGKTLLMREHAARLQEKGTAIPVYIDFEELVMSPEIFAERFIGLTAYWCLTGGQKGIDILPYLSSGFLPELVAPSPTASKVVGILIRELQKAKPDQALLLRTAFDFPEMMATELGRKVVMLLDEFQEIRAFERFEVREPLSIFRAVMSNQANVGYIIAGSAITITQKMIKEHTSPLFLQFEMLELPSFDKRSTGELLKKLIDNVTPDGMAEIYRLSHGHPFYITALAQRARRIVEADQKIDTEIAGQAFVIETLSKEGQIYNYCRYIYDLALERARGYGNLKAILQVLAEEEGLGRSEVSRRIKKGYGPTGPYLSSLVEVDLITEDNKLYYYRDPILRFWVAYATRGVELREFPKREDVLTLLRQLQRRIQALSTVFSDGEDLNNIARSISRANGVIETHPKS